MYSKAFSATIDGITPITVEVEVHAPRVGCEEIFTIVGMADTAVRESRERVRAALSNVGIAMPQGQITVSLAPAAVKKSGATLDFPVAIAVAAQVQALDPQLLQGSMIIGELALDGTLRPVQGALAISLHAREQGFKRILLPEANAKEAAVAEGVDVIPITSLREGVDYLSKQKSIEPCRIDIMGLFEQGINELSHDFSHVKGHRMVKRGLEVAAAGGHNLLMIGPPGCGKTLLANSYPGILPKLTLDEALKVTQIHSIAGQLSSDQALLTQRVFRAPHHTISDAGLLGGTSNPRPGEVSLAHHGVLFLDELPEFKRSTLEVMRQPLESGTVTISRAMGTATFPAKFMLLAAMNPCPCGFYGSQQRECRCTSSQITRYRARLSGPLLDRIDIHLDVQALSEEELNRAADGESSVNVRERVEQARAKQYARLGEGRNNAGMRTEEVQEHCQLDDACRALLKSAIQNLNLSARAYDRILRLARTLADMSGRETLSPADIGEAIQYRSLDRQAW